MEAIILMISWHYKTMKMRNNSKTKHVEKKSSNKNINDNSKKNDLKDGKNDRLEKKETLIWTRNSSGLFTFEEYKHYTDKTIKNN